MDRPKIDETRHQERQFTPLRYFFNSEKPKSKVFLTLSGQTGPAVQAEVLMAVNDESQSGFAPAGTAQMARARGDSRAFSELPKYLRAERIKGLFCPPPP